MEPIVSVIIPLFNKRQYIAQCLESALSQQGPFRLDVIVVDDGSTDGSQMAVEDFRSRIRFLEQPHAGAGAARNRALAQAAGDYVAFLDADDYWLPGKLAAQVNFLSANPTVHWCGVNLANSTRSVREHRPLLVDYSATKPHEWRVFADWFAANHPVHLTVTSCVVIKKDVFKAVGHFDEAIYSGQDMDLWIRIARVFPSFGFYTQPLAVYNRFAEGRLSVLSRAKCESTIAYLLRHLREPASFRPSEKAFLYYRLLVAVRQCLDCGYSDLARKGLAMRPPALSGPWCWAALLSRMPTAVLLMRPRLRRHIKSAWCTLLARARSAGPRSA